MTPTPYRINSATASSLDDNDNDNDNAAYLAQEASDTTTSKLSSSRTVRTLNSYDDDEAGESSSQPSGTAFRTMQYNDENEGDEVEHAHVQDDNDDSHKTTVWQTFVHLVKGYIGPGCLSLPWAMSQLGIVPGVIICFALAAWSSYNCWIVVDLKRHLMTHQSASGSGSSHARQLTYPDVAGRLYGPRAQRITALSIGTQQLAICTVFFSFCGDNLQAVLNGLIQTHIDATHPGFSHTAVITFCFPVVLALAMIPNLKGLASASAFGTVLLMIGFAILGLLVLQEWSDRPSFDATTGFPYFNTAAVSQYPLAACALLYSYEGICLILPIESAMQKPQYFGKTFCIAMFLAACTYSLVASLAVYVFGSISDGSLTAFLLEHYNAAGAPQELIWLLWIANAAVSLSVLVTFPLQLFPALELIQEALDGMRRGPGFTPVQTDEELDEMNANDVEPSHVLSQSNSTKPQGDEFSPVFTIDDEEDEEDEESNGHDYHEPDMETAAVVGQREDFEDEPSPLPARTSQQHSTGRTVSNFSSSNVLLRIALVLFTYVIAIVVPDVQSLIALAGALAGSLTALILPPVLAMAKRGGGAWTWISLLLGTTFGIVGTVAALMDIVKAEE